MKTGRAALRPARADFMAALAVLVEDPERIPIISSVRAFDAWTRDRWGPDGYLELRGRELGLRAKLHRVKTHGIGGACLLRTGDVAEAWELLATDGPLPASWVDDPARVFDWREHCQHARRKSVRAECQSCSDADAAPGRFRPHPRNVIDCLAIAADVPNVLAAEAIAREATGCSRVAWRVAKCDKLVALADERRAWWINNHAGKATLAEDAVGLQARIVLNAVRGTPEEVGIRVSDGSVARNPLPRLLGPLTDIADLGCMVDGVRDDTVTLARPALHAPSAVPPPRANTRYVREFARLSPRRL